MSRTLLLVAAVGSIGAVALMNVLPLVSSHLPVQSPPTTAAGPAVQPTAPVRTAEPASPPAPRPAARPETKPVPDLDEAQLAKATLEALAAQRTNPTETAALPPHPPVATAPAAAPAPMVPPAAAPAPAPVTMAPPPPVPAAQPPQPAAQSAALASTAPRVGIPDPDRIVLLVRTALLSLNDAMRTGNYTVLRDIGGPTFREQNSAARLSELFSNLGSQGLDLTMVAVLAPQLSEAPTLDARNTLRLKGYFPGKPLQINFEILYEPVAGHWRLFNLAVAAVPSLPQSATEVPAPARAPRTAATRPAPQ